MEEGAAIASLILAQLRGVHEETITGSQQQPGAGRSGWQPECSQIIHHQRRIGILRPEIVSEFVSQVGGGSRLAKTVAGV